MGEQTGSSWKTQSLSSVLPPFHFSEFCCIFSLTFGARHNLTSQNRLFYKYYSPSQTLFFILLTRVLSSLNVFSLVISPAVDAIVSNSSMLISSPTPTTTIVTLFLFNAIDARATARMFSDFPLVNTMRTFGTSGREPPFAEKRFTRANCNASSCFVLPPSAKTMLSTISCKRKILLSALNCKSNTTLAIAEDRITPTRVPFAEMWKFSITDHKKRLASWNSLSLTDEESSMKARSAFPEQTKHKTHCFWEKLNFYRAPTKNRAKDLEKMDFSKIHLLLNDFYEVFVFM